MMVLTSNGLLKTEMTAKQLKAMVNSPSQEVQIWWCPLGHYDPRFILNRQVFEEVYKQLLEDGAKALELDSESEFQFYTHKELHKGVVGALVEDYIWKKMDVLFYECPNVPSPNTDPDVVAKNWADSIMYKLTKYGDEGGLTPEPTEDQLWKIDKLRKLILSTPGCNQPECGCADGLRQQKIDALKVQL
jgi:hypothetical protein